MTTLLLLGLLTEGVVAQQPLRHLYTAADGLGFKEAQFVKRDTSGYLWVVSTNGVLSRFDGQEFRVWPFGNAPAVEISAIRKTAGGNVYGVNNIGDRQAAHYLIGGDTIRLFDPIPGIDLRIIDNYKEDGTVAFVSADSLYHYSIQSVELVRRSAIPSLLRSDDRRSNYFLDSGDQLRLRNSTPAGDHYLMGVVDGRRDTLLSVRQSHPPSVVPVGTDSLLIFAENRLMLTNNDFEPIAPYLQVEGLFESDYPHLQRYHEGKPILVVNRVPETSPTELITLSLNKGIHIASRHKLSSRINARGNVLPQGEVSSEEVWYGDHGGVHRLYLDYEVFREEEEGMIVALHALNYLESSGDVIMGGYGTGFTRWDGNTLERIDRPELPSTLRIMPGSFRDEQGNIYFLIERGQRTLIQFNARGETRQFTLPTPDGTNNATGYHFSRVRLARDAPLLRGRDFPEGRDTIDFMCISLANAYDPALGDRYGQFQLIELPIGERIDPIPIGTERGLRSLNVLCTTQDRAGKIWYGHTRTGMGFYDPGVDSCRHYAHLMDGDPGVISMVVDRRDRLWMATRAGLYYVEDVSDIAFSDTLHLRSRQKKCNVREIPDNYVVSLLLRGDTLIAGHTGGVSFIDVSGEVDRPPAVTLSGDFTGLGQSEQNALLIDRDGWLWAGGDGAIRIDYRTLLARDRGREATTRLVLTGDQGELRDPGDGQLLLPLGDRSLRVTFDLGVRDKMKDILRADIWIHDAAGRAIDSLIAARPGEELEKDYLEPGDFTVVADIIGDNQVIARREVGVTVPKRLREYWWFYAALVGAVALFVIGSLLLLIQRSRNRLARQRLLTELTKAKLRMESEQVSTLVNTINPHFLANAIQWMQSAAAINRSAEEINAIGHSLARNMRSIYTKSNARRVSHKLAEELEVVRDYFKIVNIEYDGVYEFELPTAEELAPFAEVETFLLQIQIHAENAVERGLLNRQRGRRVAIRLADEGPYLRITIEDDGAGATRARQLQDRHAIHRGSGLGTSILGRLYEIFNERNAYPVRSQMDTDLYPESDGSGQFYGTRITLHIPKTYTYDLESLGSGG